MGQYEMDHLVSNYINTHLRPLAKNIDQIKRTREIRAALTKKLNSQFYHHCKLDFERPATAARGNK